MIGVRFPEGTENFSTHHRVHTGSGTHPASYPMGTEGSFPGGKASEREADHSPPPSAEVKNVWSYTSSPQYVFMAWCLVKHRDKFTLPGWTIGVLGFDSRWGLGIFLFTTVSRTVLSPTQPPIQWVPGSLSLWVKRSGREADHSPPSSGEVKECVELYLPSPVRLYGVVIILPLLLPFKKVRNVNSSPLLSFTKSSL
jgi:hypothetical protein